MIPALVKVRIRCMVCDLPVEHWVAEYDFDQMAHVIRVRCHGTEDRMVMSAQFVAGNPAAMNDILAGRIEGQAFTTPLLEKPA